jgi:hypothetical protein
MAFPVASMSGPSRKGLVWSVGKYGTLFITWLFTPQTTSSCYQSAGFGLWGQHDLAPEAPAATNSP